MLAVPGHSYATRIPPKLSPMKCAASRDSEGCPRRLARLRRRSARRQRRARGMLVAVVAPEVLGRTRAHELFHLRIHAARGLAPIFRQRLVEEVEMQPEARAMGEALGMAEDDRGTRRLLQAPEERHRVGGAAEEIRPIAIALSPDPVPPDD